MKIRLYSRHDCSECQMVKQLLQEYEFDFEDIEVGGNVAAARELAEEAEQYETPTLVISKDNGEELVISGYDEQELMNALELGQL